MQETPVNESARDKVAIIEVGMASVLLGVFHSGYWFALTVFVALNLIQSAFTDWCPMMSILKAAGFES